MSRPESDRRRHPRFEVAGVGGRLVVPIKICILNMSLGGMAVETSGHLQFGRDYSLKLHGDAEDLPLRATVAWCALRRTTRSPSGEVVPVYHAGLKFEAMSQQRTQVLWQLIHRHALVEVEDSVLGRFRVDLPGESRLGTSYDFAVRKLSLSGMLIETDFVPTIDARFQLLLRLGGSPWETQARVASVPQSGRVQEGELIQVGLEFSGLGSREAAQLQTFIDTRLQRLPGS